MNLFLLDQASRRCWRLGKREAVKIFYLAYAGSVAHKKLVNLGTKSGAAAAFAGEPARGALVEYVGADKTMLARLSRGLFDAFAEEEQTPMNAEERLALENAQLQAAFAQRAEELQQALHQGRRWVGVEDTLPERLRQFHASLTAQQSPTHEEAMQTIVFMAPEQEVIGESATSLVDSIEAIPEPVPVAASVSHWWDDPVLRQQTCPRKKSRSKKKPLPAAAGLWSVLEEPAIPPVAPIPVAVLACVTQGSLFD